MQRDIQYELFNHKFQEPKVPNMFCHIKIFIKGLEKQVLGNTPLQDHCCALSAWRKQQATDHHPSLSRPSLGEVGDSGAPLGMGCTARLQERGSDPASCEF